MTIDKDQIIQQLREENEQLRAEIAKLDTLRTQVTSLENKQRNASGFLRDPGDELEKIVGIAQCIFDQTGSSVAVYEVTGDGEDFLFKDINSAGEKIAGITKEKLLGRSLLEVFPGVSKSGVLDVFREVWRTGITSVCPPHAYSDTRLSLWTEDTVIRLSSGDLVQICKDLTEWKNLENKRLESEELYRTLVENAKEEIILLGVDGSYRFVNQRYARYMDRSPGDFAGRTLWDFLPQAIADEKMAILHQVVETGESQTITDENVFQGKRHLHEMTLVPLLDDNKNVKFVMLVARDITQIKHAQDELTKQQEKMGRAEHLASVGLLSAMVAHEMAQPMTVTRLSIQNAMAGSPEQKDADWYENLTSALEAIENQAEIVSRFRGFARTSKKGDAGTINLEGIIENTKKLMNDHCHRQQLTITIIGAEELPPIHGNRNDIEQLCFILVENCLHAAVPDQENTLTITCSVEDGQIVLRFEDNCGGITLENVGQIFEPFFTTKSDDLGTGLGLCVAKSIVTDAQGVLTVDNRPGEGVTFCVSLAINKG